MLIYKKIWHSFKIQPEIWCYCIFLMTVTLQVRKVIANYPILGAFNEYSGIYIYLSDLLLILTIGTWLGTLLYNKYTNLSIERSFNVPRGTNIYYIVLPAFLVLWSFATFIWSVQPDMAVYRSLKLFEFYLLYLFIALNPKCSTWNILRIAFWIIIATGLIQSIIAITQFILQSSVGLYWLKESYLSSSLSGVAKIVINGHRYLRAYGLFPHPNILGGFLFFTIILTVAYRKLFSSLINVPCGTIYYILLGTQIVAGILTFSKSFILGIILAMVYVSYYTNVSRRTFGNIHKSKILKVIIDQKIGLLAFLLFASILLIGSYMMFSDLKVSFIKSIDDRLVYMKIAKNVINENSLFGIGSGQFVIEMKDYANEALLDWQFQPVHNIFILILSELGMIGLSLFGWFAWKLFHVEHSNQKSIIECSSWNNSKCDVYGKKLVENVSRETIGFRIKIIHIFKAILMGFLVISLFDHYLWDIQQGEIMLWIAFGYLAGNKIMH